MTPDKAIKWLQAEQFNQWFLLRGEDEKVSSYEGEESVEDSISRFIEIIELQMPGKYLLKGYKGKSKQAASMSFRFEIKPEVQSPTPRNSGSSFNPEDLFNKAKEAALREFEMNQWRKDVEKNLQTLNDQIADLKKSIVELNDDDDENDDDALERISNVAQQLPGLAKGFEGMKGMFSK